MKYSTLLLDLDETIFDFKKAEYISLSMLMKSHNIEPDDEKIRLFSSINSSKWDLLEQGKITRDRLVVSRFEDFFSAVNIDEDAEKANYEYVGYISQCGFPLEGALETCKKLSEKYRLYIITNGSIRPQTGRLSDSPLLSYVDKVFISEEIGFAKPQREYFDYVLNNIEEKDKSKILVVGDSLKSDIAGAVSAGLDSCWVNRNNKTSDVPDYEIKSINDIFEIL